MTTDTDTIEPTNVGPEIARILGLDPETTCKVEMTPEGPDFLLVTVTMHGHIYSDSNSNSYAPIVDLIKQFQLVPVEARPGVINLANANADAAEPTITYASDAAHNLGLEIQQINDELVALDREITVVNARVDKETTRRQELRDRGKELRQRLVELTHVTVDDPWLM
jgi:hypothetical protein